MDRFLTEEMGYITDLMVDGQVCKIYPLLILVNLRIGYFCTKFVWPDTNTVTDCVPSDPIPTDYIQWDIGLFGKPKIDKEDLLNLPTPLLL